MMGKITLSMILNFVFIFTPVFSQDEITETIEQAKQLYLQNDLSETATQLSRALELVNSELLIRLESIFPEPLKNWRMNTPTSRINKTAYTSGLISTCKYFKKGGGSSLDIRVETNTPRIANIKRAFVNPAMIKQLGSNAKISTVDDRRCIECYDPIDNFAELIFVANSSILITIRGHDVKNTKIAAKYAKNIEWDSLEEIFR